MDFSKATQLRKQYIENQFGFLNGMQQHRMNRNVLTMNGSARAYKMFGDLETNKQNYYYRIDTHENAILGVWNKNNIQMFSK